MPIRPAIFATILAFTLAGCLDGPAPKDQDAGDPSDDAATSRTPSNRTRVPAGGANESLPRDFGPWPELAQATVRPGVVVGGGCTSNFLFNSTDNSTLYLGLAAHCVVGVSLNETMTVEGADKRGWLAYSSWMALNLTCEGLSPNAACDQDFALVALNNDDRDRIHPALRHYGGPTALADSRSLQEGDRVMTYGQSSLRQGVEPTNPREGVVSQSQSGDKFQIVTATPGVPGDSGSAVVRKSGEAVGVLVDVGVAPNTAQNGIVGLSHALEVAREKGGLEVHLVTWRLLDEGLP